MIIIIKFRWALFVTYKIIQSITSSEMCSLHLTHPSAHTLGAVGSRHCGARGAVGGSVPCSRVSPQSWTIPAGAEIRKPPTSGYKSDALSIRTMTAPSAPRLPPQLHDCPLSATTAPSAPRLPPQLHDCPLSSTTAPSAPRLPPQLHDCPLRATTAPSAPRLPPQRHDCPLSSTTAPSEPRLPPQRHDCPLRATTAPSAPRLPPQRHDCPLSSTTAPSEPRLPPQSHDCPLSATTAPSEPWLPPQSHDCPFILNWLWLIKTFFVTDRWRRGSDIYLVTLHPHLPFKRALSLCLGVGRNGRKLLLLMQ